jgi:hypothetical protein
MNKYITISISALLLFASCNREDEPPVVIPATRTVIVYMAADNDLSADAFSDIEEIKEGFEETGTNLVVFIDPAGESPSHGLRRSCAWLRQSDGQMDSAEALS